jgi:deazaflavin-dependent oxidoreductase (nitroreductase family)
MSPVLGKRAARFNRRVTNRITRPIAPWLPLFGVVVHTGRRSGREYHTPVNVFCRGSGVIIALTYGPESDWVLNVLAAGGCDLVTRGTRHTFTAPRLVHDERRSCVPAPVRVALRILGVADFLALVTPPAE